MMVETLYKSFITFTATQSSLLVNVHFNIILFYMKYLKAVY